MMADQKGKKYEIHNQDQWKKYNDNYTYDTQKDGDLFGEIKEIIEEIENGNIDTLELSRNQCRNRPRGGLAQAGNLATDETSRINERMVDFMKIETEEQKEKQNFRALQAVYKKSGK